MSYYNYAYLLEDTQEIQADNQRVSQNWNQLSLLCSENKKAFTAGLIAGILVQSSPAHAVDQPAKKARAKAAKEVTERFSNAFACGAITSICGKSASSGAKEAVKQAAASGIDPKVAGAFACGVLVAWCVKYVIFEN